MKWNVYTYDSNRKKIADFNIFEHRTFVEYVKDAIEKIENKEVFANQLKTELAYCFWSKSQWEILITPWVGGDRERDAVKIDVFDQVMMNWDIFVDYVWNNKEEVLKLGD